MTLNSDGRRAGLSSSSGESDRLRRLAAALRRTGQIEEADRTDIAAIEASAAEPDMQMAIGHLVAGEMSIAERLVRKRLQQRPEDAAALCMLSDIAYRVGIYHEAEQILRRVVDLAPGFLEAQIKLSQAIFQQNRGAEAVEVLDAVLAKEPDNALASGSRIRMLGLVGEYGAAEMSCRELVERFPENAVYWVNYANVLKTVGKSAAAVAGYRRAAELDPTMGLAWWSISNMKSGHLDRADIATMTELLDEPSISDTSRLHLHFALGKALEDAADYEGSFKHYAEANRLRLISIPHDRSEVTNQVDEALQVFTRDFFAARDGWGTRTPDPIFIIGMPRAGSTLLEQILATHPSIEGTSELSDIPLLVHQLVAERWTDSRASYPHVVEELDADQVTKTGDAYIRSSRPHRKSSKPYFVDKLPNNWLYVGLISLILPNAKIIDARRSAMACCFSNFKQHFARGQPFAYSLADVGTYYRDYVRLMTHFDEVLPGRVLRVDHERVVANPESEVHRMLDYLGLPFDPACLQFHRNKRPVRTASSEQVRRPISRNAVDLWRNYEPWLGALKEALGPLADP